MALADTLSGAGWLIVLVFWKVTKVAPYTFVMSKRKRKGEINMVDRCIVSLYVTVTVKEGPAPAGVLLPAQTLRITGVAEAVCAASVVGTPEGVSQTRLLLVDGQSPAVIPAPETATLGLSDAVPWLSMQKYAGVAAAPEVNAQGREAKPVLM